MTGWIVFAAILFFLFLISLLRLGGQVKYDLTGFSVVILIGPIRIRLLPTGQKKREKKQSTRMDKKKAHRPEATAGHTEKGAVIGRVMDTLPLIAEAAGALKRKIRIDHLNLTVVWASDDPANAALGYGRANAVLGMIWPLLDHNFNVKRCNWQVDVDYEKTAPELSVDAAITATIGQLVLFAICYGTKILIKLRRSVKGSANQQEG